MHVATATAGPASPEQTTSPSVTVVIAFKRANAYLREALEALCKLDYPAVEVLLLPDGDVGLPDEVIPSYVPGGEGRPAVRTRVVPTGPLGPAAKRDLALHHANGEILAFLDDDCRPSEGWLRGAIRCFADPEVGAVCGPAITAAGDGVRQQASGCVYAALLGGGPYAYRYMPQPQREVDDYPTCNLLVRRSVFEALGGFDTRYWPGEDTVLCLGITRELGMKIVYDPDVLVEHHRRRLWRPHLRQVRSYALHRGYFAKRFPATSLRPSYFLPTALVGLLGAAVSSLIIAPAVRPWALMGLAGYLAAIALSAWRVAERPLLTMLTISGILTTHIVYGIWFVIGLLSPSLSEERPGRKGA